MIDAAFGVCPVGLALLIFLASLSMGAPYVAATLVALGASQSAFIALSELAAWGIPE